jgi:hypothetical protein
MKKPKMPKANASLSTWNSYKEKLKQHAAKKKVIEDAKALRNKL